MKKTKVTTKKTAKVKSLKGYNHKEGSVLKAMNLVEQQEALKNMCGDLANIVFDTTDERTSQSVERVEKVIEKYKLNNHALAFVIHATATSIAQTIKFTNMMEMIGGSGLLDKISSKLKEAK